MHHGEHVIAVEELGGPLCVVPAGTPGVVVDERPSADRYEVRFANGRTEICLGRQLAPGPDDRSGGPAG